MVDRRMKDAKGKRSGRAWNAPAQLCVMTYNLKFASPDPPNPWPGRRPLMAELIKTYAPDVIGSQEGLYPQIKDILADCPGYGWIGLGREGGSRGEFMAIFYRHHRLEPLAFDHFWLSDAPETIGSTTWGNTDIRMVTWTRFLDRHTDREFYFFNTHFDHRYPRARENSAHLVLERVGQLGGDIPVILGGDFNAPAGRSETYDILVGSRHFSDAWTLAEERVGEGLNTYQGFKRHPHRDDVRIDWILVRGEVQVQRSEIVTFRKDGRYPSDHFPVVAWLTMANSKVPSQQTGREGV
jgi:endonuclease/exonuclease/phosphatase family metal-dependent hydrolase